jgi:class 3 adenylate cyclase
MTFLDTIGRVKAYILEHGRVSLRALKREFELDDDAVDDLVEELVSVQAVATRQGDVIVSVSSPAAELPQANGGGQTRDPRQYTPKHLVDKVLRMRGVLEGERKQVTVLFADVKGSMELAEQLDAEQWHTILDRFFQILTEGIHRFEGTVNQYTGDGVMALFGAPIAHEDHAQRACFAVLQLRDAISAYATAVKREHGVGFSTRMGMHSGEVVVGAIGDDLRMDYTAQGHTVGLAQRLEALASPDTCYLTATTAALVKGYVELEDLGQFQVKGAREPVHVHRLVGAGSAQTRFDLSRARGLTRFVGRDADMATLDAALAQAQAGNGQVVGVVAEAGTGKSRLCYEFVERCRAHGVTVLEGHAVAHGKNVPYLPMLEVFRAFYGIADQDDDYTVREKIAGRLLLSDESFREVLPVMFEFFGVPDPDRPAPSMSPEAKQSQLFAVLRRLVQEDTRADARNLVVLIEDLHWFDSASEVFLEQWVEALAGSSSFLLVNFRPEYHAEWTQKSYYRQVPLTPLGTEAICELLADLLGADTSVQGVAEAIHARSGGNPFFTEEIVQALIESGQLEGSRGAYRLTTPVERLDVPASVQAVLGARIDRLPGNNKHVLQAAAVIGTEFTEPILSAAAELPVEELRTALAALRTGEFIYDRALYPVAEYAFKHPLTQEVALGSQLQDRRRRTHALVACAIEEILADKLDEHAALLAHHWEEANERLVAAQWHRRAAERVGHSDAFQAFPHLQRILALTDELEPSSERDELRLEACRSLLLKEGWSIGLSREEREAFFVEGLDLAQRSGDVGCTVDLHVGHALGCGVGGDLRAYYEGTRTAAALVDETVSRGTAAMSLSGLCYSSYLVGELHESLENADRAACLTEGDPTAGVETAGFSAWIYSFQGGAQALAILGRLDAARARAKEGLDLAQLHDRFMTSALLTTQVEVMDWSGSSPESSDAAAAQRYAVEAVERAGNVGGNFGRIDVQRILALVRLLNGDWGAARNVLQEALASMRRERVGLEREAMVLTYLARAEIGLGETEAACATAEQAVALAHRQGARFQESMGEVVHASTLRAHLGVDASDESEACLARGHALMEETGGRVLGPQITEERARIAALKGDEVAAREQLGRAHELYVEIGARGHAERLAQELANCSESWER